MWGALGAAGEHWQFCSVRSVGDAELLTCMGTWVSSGLVMLVAHSEVGGVQEKSALVHPKVCVGAREVWSLLPCVRAVSLCRAPRAAPSPAGLLHITFSWPHLLWTQTHPDLGGLGVNFHCFAASGPLLLSQCVLGTSTTVL